MYDEIAEFLWTGILSNRDKQGHLEYLNFDLEIGSPAGREYPLAVLQSPAG
jgi:hypothetical protein